MTEKVTIEIESKDNTDQVVKNMVGNYDKAASELEQAGNVSSEAAEKSTLSWTDLNSVIQIGTKIFDKAVEIGKDLYDTYTKYADSVRNLSLISGTSAEETSRLIQVLDDYQISAKDAETATKKLKDNGLVPTVDTLAKLSDEYLAIADPAERMAFIQDNLGKSGMKWVNVLNQGRDAILANAKAVDKNLILTDQQVADYEKERLALDKLNDSIEGVKVQMGSWIGQQILANEKEEEFRKNLEALNPQLYNQYVNSHTAGRGVEELRAQLERGKALTEALTHSTEDNTRAQQDNAQAIEDATKVNESYLSSIGNITDQIQNYKDKQTDLQKSHQELLDEKQKLINQGWWAESEKIQDVNQKLAENEQAQADNAAAFDKATKERMLSMLEEQLASDGLDKNETEFLLHLGEQWGIYTQEAVSQMEAAQKKIDEFKQAIDTVPEERTFTMQVLVKGADAIGGLGAGFGSEKWGGAKALGGPVSGGKMYEVTEHGMPEMLAMNGRQYLMMPPDKSGDVVPVGYGGGSGQGVSGGSVVVNLTYSPAVSLGSRSEAMNTLIPLIIQGVQEAKVQGKIQ